MEGGTSGVKQFDSYTNMQNSTGNIDGDLAAIYASTQSNFTESTQTQYITFPETVTLPSSIGEDYAQIQLQAVDESIMLDCMGNLSSTRFNVDIYIELDGDYKEYRIQYESSNGLNYTRTRFESDGEPLENPVDLTTPVKWGSKYGEAQWNDLIGYFMIVGSSTYGGLYEYNGTNTQYESANTQLNTIADEVYNKSFYNGNGKFDGTLQNINNLSIDEVKRRVNLYDNLSYLELNENITDMNYMFAGSKLMTIPNFDTSKVTNMNSMFAECTNLMSIPQYDTSNVIDATNMFSNCTNLSNSSLFNISVSVPSASQINYPLVNYFGIGYNRFDSISRSVLFNKGYLDCDINTIGWSTAYNINGNLISRGTDFDRYGDIISSSIPDITYLTVSSQGSDNGIIFSFQNGFQRKYNMVDLNIQLNTSNLLTTVAMFKYSSNLESVSNFDTSNVTNMCMMFSPCVNLVNVPNFNTSKVIDMRSMFDSCGRLTNIPNFDTSNVTNMAQMFYYCNNLVTVPNFDTSNVTSMSGMFVRCNCLTNVPQFDTSNVTNMCTMFQACFNLTTVPNFNTSKVTDMSDMFPHGYKLTSIPNFDTSNVVDMRQMLYYCINLIDVPQFNTSNVTDMSYMFHSCNNLSNASIQNIINMVLNSNITDSRYMNLNNSASYSPFYSTKFDSSYYSNRLAELTTKGWSY